MSYNLRSKRKQEEVKESVDRKENEEKCEIPEESIADNDDHHKNTETLKAHFELVKSDVKEYKTVRKIELKSKWCQERLQILETRESGQDPLLLFPEEIWTMVLEYITDENDLFHCIKVCRLFDRVLKDLQSQGQWMFGKIFEHLFPYLSKDDSKKCRSICQQWRVGVDSVLDNYYSIKTDRKSNVREQIRHLFDRTHNKFNFELKYSLGENNQRIRDRLRKRLGVQNAGGNPFLGRSITVKAVNLGYLFPNWKQLVFSYAFPLFMANFGESIWHLTLEADPNYYFENIGEYWKYCKLILAKLPNLRSLLINNCTLSPKMLKTPYLETVALESHSHLENLKIVWGFPFYCKYQDKLVRKYSNQLKRLDVVFWNVKLYHKFSWGNLQELKVGQGKSSKVLKSLQEMSAPKLRQLSIRVNGRKPKLAKLVQTLSSFPNLNHVELKFAEKFLGFSAIEIAGLPNDLRILPLVRTLEVTIPSTEMSFDFLMVFPCLNKLLVRYGYWALFRHDLIVDSSSEEESDEDEEADRTDKSLAIGEHQDSSEESETEETSGDEDEGETGDESEEDPKTDQSEDEYSDSAYDDGNGEGAEKEKPKYFKSCVIFVGEHLRQELKEKKDKTEVYNSNVWEMIPSLKLLEICNTNSTYEKQFVFSRRGYDSHKQAAQ